MNREVFRYSLFILFLILSCCIYAQDQEVEKNLQLADSQYASGDVSGALKTIEDILVKQPDNLDAQEKKINMLVQQERSKDALKDIEDYIMAYPSKPEYYYLRAILKLQDQKYSKSIEDFDMAIKLDMPPGTEYKVYLNRGMANFYNQDYELAENDFKETIALNPKCAPAYHGLGIIKYQLNQYEDAITDFQKSLKLDDNNAITHYNMAMTYFRMKDTENACYHFNRSCALGHRNACRLLMMQCNIDITK